MILSEGGERWNTLVTEQEVNNGTDRTSPFSEHWSSGMVLVVWVGRMGFGLKGVFSPFLFSRAPRGS